ncbi:unnamed protein product [Spirodela intermedia]|uniref:Uncharacterized protein n=1 Tax=Spirodela intermedia TaxID=51605 RepID=A0A7I8ILT0_SPIIN|nr:unnamed protein product [Spirodela intermedia]CAA6658706.1 unnamed protein product [Spirodela intermedia]
MRKIKKMENGMKKEREGGRREKKRSHEKEREINKMIIKREKYWMEVGCVLESFILMSVQQEEALHRIFF